MRIHDAFNRCVCFIGYQVGDTERVGASAFFVEFEPGVRLAVTARHVIDSIRASAPPGTPVRLWVNRVDGLGYLDTEVDDWLFHPSNPSIDAAVWRHPVPWEGLGHLAIQRQIFITDAFIDEQKVGIGDELFFPGLFVHHRGANRVRPIMRQGTIAAVPEEPVKTAIGPMEAYLAEVRSIGGLSGSPVFLHMDPFRVPPGDEPLPEDSPPVTFIGLVHGHHDWRTKLGQPIDLEAINMGISVILPAQRIREVIEQSAMAVASRSDAELPVMDATFAGAEFRPVEFERTI